MSDPKREIVRQNWEELNQFFKAKFNFCERTHIVLILWL